MSAPTLHASLDRATYAPGDLMTLTVTYGDPDNTDGTVTVIVTDKAGGTSEPAVVAYTIADQVTLEVADTGSRTFAKVSDNGTVAVFTATA